MGFGFLLAMVFLLRNPLLSSIVQTQLERLTGGEVRVVRARFEGLASVHIDVIELRAPGWEGPAAECLLVEGLEANLRITSLLTGGFGFDSISADHVRLRIAEAEDDPTRLNVTSLRPPEDERVSDPDPDRASELVGGIGLIVVERLDIESGIATGDEWRPESVGSYFALVEPLDVDGRSHEFTLASLDGDHTVAIAKGTLDARSGGFELRTNDVDLQRGATLVLSASAKAVVDALDLRGTLREATVFWRPGEPPRANLRVDDLSFTPPKETALTEQWVRFADGRILNETPPFPRLQLDRGLIELDGDLISMSGEGGRMLRDAEPEALPTTSLSAEFRARLVAESAPEDESLEDWGGSILRSTPFELRLAIDRFIRDGDGSGAPVDLPRPVAEALELLTATAWDLTATAEVHRGRLDGDVDPDAPIRSRATLEIADGRGMYHEFRYPLHAVRATLAVEDDQVLVQSLEGLGPSDDVVTLRGRIDGLGDDAGVDLRLGSPSIGLDDDLLAALPDTTRRGLRTLFDPLAASRLEAAGLIPDAEALAKDLQSIPELEVEMADAAAAGDRFTEARLAAEVARRRTRVANGPFRIGGTAALDLRIHRPRRRGHPVAVEGPIDLLDVGGVFSRFPYPLFVERGRIVLEDLAVVLDEPGLEVATIEGGRGIITGRVDLPRDGEGGRDVHPELDLRIRGDALGPALFAAIPPELDDRPSPEAIPGWPGIVRAEAVAPIIDMGLDGTIDYGVRITTVETGDDRGDARFLVEGVLRNGTAGPHDETSRTVADAGLVWPRDFTLDDVQATITIDDEGLDLTSFTGHRGAGTVHARATYDFATEVGRGIARLRDLEIDKYLLDLIPSDTIDDARTLWNRWHPAGRTHADLRWSRRGGVSELRLEAEPLWAEIDTTIGRTRVEVTRGRLRFGDDAIEVDDIAVTFGADGRQDGALRLTGDYGYGDVGTHRLNGVLDDGRFESPAIDELLRLVVGDAFASWWRDRSPTGRFTGRFELATGESSSVEAELVPTSFTLLSRTGDPSSRGGGRIVGDGSVRIDDRRVSIGPLELRSPDGGRIGLDLRVDDVERPEIAARFRIGLPDATVPEVGFVPPPFSSILAAEGLTAERLEVVGELVARFGDGANATVPMDPGIPDFYRATGTLDLASLTWSIGGTPIETAAPRRPIEMELDAVDGVPTWFDLRAELPLVHVARRPITDVVLRGELAGPRTSMPGAIRIESVQGRLGDGEVRLDALVDPATAEYEVAIAVADAPLDALTIAEIPADGVVATSTSDANDAADRLPGRLSARLLVRGDPADASTRVGRGRVEIREARLADGGTLALLQLGQLMPPIADELASAEARIWIDGSMARLTDVRVDAETVRLQGEGTMRLEDWEWKVRLQPRGSLPGVADLVSVIAGTLHAIDISGTPDAPKFNLTPLPLVIQPPAWSDPPPSTPDTVDDPPAPTDADPTPETNP